MAIQNLSAHHRGGNWVPMISAQANLDAVNFIAGWFAIVGDTVLCFATFTVDQTAASTSSFEVSLPFGEDFTATSDVVGVVGAGEDGFGGRCEASVANNTAVVHFDSGSIALQSMSVVLAYRTNV